MRVSMPHFEPNVDVDHEDNRPIVLRLRSLRISMTHTEAVRLADLLIDATERTSHE